MYRTYGCIRGTVCYRYSSQVESAKPRGIGGYLAGPEAGLGARPRHWKLARRPAEGKPYQVVK